MAFALAVLTLVDVVMREHPAPLDYSVRIMQAAGAGLVIADLGGRWLAARMKHAIGPARPPSSPLSERLIVGILLLEAIALVAWLVVHAMFLMLGGLSGFYEYWRIALGILVLALVVVAGVNGRAVQSWVTATRVAAFLGCLVAMTLGYRADASPVHQAAVIGAGTLAVIGLVLVAITVLRQNQPAGTAGRGC